MSTFPAPLDPWPAPRASSPVSGTVRVPGSKSLTNRYLVLAALADGPSRLRGVLDSRDSRLMVQALVALGATITEVAPGTVEVTPLPTPVPTTGPDAGPGGPGGPLGDVTIDCGLAGTVMRFVPPVAALVSGTVRFTGDEAALSRPMGPVLDGLAGLGVRMDGPGLDAGTLPFTVHGTGGVDGGRVEVDASGSSQFVSALLLAAPRFRDGLHLVHTGATVPSPEHVGMTVAVLRRCGVQVDDSVPGEWRVSPGPIRALDTAVEPDLSNAGPFLAAAVATAGTVSVPDWPAQTTQIGDRWRSILPAFGARVDFSPTGPDGATGTLTVTGGPRITAPGEIADTGELAPTVAALCLLAEGPGQLTRIGQLRGHETDRLTALATEAGRIGGAVEEGRDHLVFTGLPAGAAPLHGATLETYEDHRMATFAAVVGLAVPDVAIRNIATTAKTMPDFPEMWTRLVGG
ncbi:3-phosphoshikimate 1-carboxyvinyltransferase [Citricoccus nitrophenolicus]|uniref:3-phosphoshikimate 1-carboxyvinyltransferase n=1 Tax=Citricoccus muralis TaxID=169134 RepID=A0A3D9LAE8_9MICC|nr:3-phosphoshikimate 1-carboxyvinyltransferase [Citricoccus muralis]REE02636.1 3-phosphoshikimate 1-carboxyvinyltransferase [Citricoccus muralis]